MFINGITQKIRTSYRHKLSCIFSIGILIPLLIIFIVGIVYFTHQSVQIVNDKTKIEENSVTKKFDDAFNSIYNKMFYLINLDILHEVLHTDKALAISEQLDINEKRMTLTNKVQSYMLSKGEQNHVRNNHRLSRSVYGICIR